MNVTILYGGKSGEHEVSLVSAASVARNIDSKKHKINLIGITKNGKWFLQNDNELERIKKDTSSSLKIIEDEKRLVSINPAGGKFLGLFCKDKKIGAIETDIVFPVLHGTYGEDGTIQGLFEMANLPYCGCNVMASALTMDKEKTKQVWENANLPVVPYVTVRKFEIRTEEKLAQIIAKIEKTFSYPVFVKPCCAGSSVGANKANNKDELLKNLAEAFEWDEKVLVEKNINAREIECSVIGNNEIHVFDPGEILPTHTFYNYEAKYKDPNGAKLQIPANLNESQKEKILEIAKKAFAILDARGFSRIDFFIDKNDDKIYLNEINTIPGFTSISMFPKMCDAAGLKYPELIEKILNLGIENFNSRRSLKTSFNN
ncbi:MAG: D-alanine--D-alanine ligase [Treponema sp.]|nr:D-alanine--D-alanine ligase [Treponema sp.]